jgi:hypothetical protein
MKTYKFICQIEDFPYGLPFAYEYGNIFKMNCFIAYLVEWKCDIYDRLESMISEQKFLKLKNEIEKHDQFPIQYFYNLTSLDIKLVDWANLKLVFKDNIATLS